MSTKQPNPCDPVIDLSSWARERRKRAGRIKVYRLASGTGPLPQPPVNARLADHSDEYEFFSGRRLTVHPWFDD